MRDRSVDGVDFVGFLTLLFVALKLTGYVDWSWWWVLSPLWLTAVLFVAIIALVVIVALFE